MRGLRRARFKNSKCRFVGHSRQGFRYEGDASLFELEFGLQFVGCEPGALVEIMEPFAAVMLVLFVLVIGYLFE